MEKNPFVLVAPKFLMNFRLTNQTLKPFRRPAAEQDN